MVLTKGNSHPAAAPGLAALSWKRPVRSGRPPPPGGAAEEAESGFTCCPPACCGLAARAFWLTEVSEFLFCCQILEAANEVCGKT